MRTSSAQLSVANIDIVDLILSQYRERARDTRNEGDNVLNRQQRKVGC
jgi:hypothetical protein